MSISDSEQAFYRTVLADTQNKSLSDLRYAYYLQQLDGQNATVRGVPQFDYGTSWTNGSAATGGNSFIEKLVAALGSTANTNGSAGGSNTPSLPYQYVDHPTAKWTPGASRGIIFADVGIGEALAEVAGRIPQTRRVFESQILTMLRWFKSSAARKYGHASITLGTGAVSESISVSGVSASPGVKLTAQNGFFTIKVGSGVSEVVLLGLPWRQSAEAENGDYNITVNGITRKATTKAMGDPRDDASAVLMTLSSERITGVKGGDVITVTRTSATGNLWFWGYLEMSNPAPPPVILVKGMPVPNANAASLAIYNSIIDRVVASPEFKNVAVADAGPMYQGSTDVSGDNTHPNDAGHDRLFWAAYQAAVSLE